MSSRLSSVRDHTLTARPRGAGLGMRWMCGGPTNIALGLLYGVAHSTVSRIRLGQSHRDAQRLEDEMKAAHARR